MTTTLPIVSDEGLPVVVRYTNVNTGVADREGNKIIKEEERVMQWSWHSVRSVEEGHIDLWCPSPPNCENVVYGTGKGKDFKPFSEPLRSQWPQTFIDKLAKEQRIFLNRDNKGQMLVEDISPGTNFAYYGDRACKGLDEYTLKQFKGRNYYERLFDNMPPELKDKYEIKSPQDRKDREKIRGLIADCLEAVFKDCGVQLFKLNTETGDTTFGNTVEYYKIGPDKIPNYENPEDKRATEITWRNAERALDRLGMKQIGSHRRYWNRLASITNSIVIEDMPKFFREAMQLGIAPKVKDAHAKTDRRGPA